MVVWKNILHTLIVAVYLNERNQFTEEQHICYDEGCNEFDLV